MQVYARIVIFQLPSEGLNTAQVARLAGVHKDTLLRWLRDGNVSEPSRDRRGWRVFSPSEADQVVRFASTSAKYCQDHSDSEAIVQRIAPLRQIDWDFTQAKTVYLTHGVHPYPAKFIPQIPNALIQELSSVGDSVADIFCGSGTTLVEALTLKRNAIGVDANPLACLISRAKTARITAEDFDILTQVANKADQYAVELLGVGNGTLFPGHAFESKASRPESEAISFWFEPFIIEELAEIRAWCRSLESKIAMDIAQAAFSAIIVAVSRQDSDTRYVRRGKAIKPGDAFRRFASALKSTSLAAREFSDLAEPRFACRVHCASVLDSPPIGNIDLVVCSPPYPNAYSYHLYHMTRMLWLEMNQPKFKEQEIGSHRKYGKKGPTGATVDTFRNEMCTIFSWLRNHLRPDRFACFIVGPSTIKGTTVDNATLIANAAASFGFVEHARLKRNMKDTQKAFNPAHGKIKTEEILILQYRSA